MRESLPGKPGATIHRACNYEVMDVNCADVVYYRSGLMDGIEWRSVESRDYVSR